MNHNHYKIIKHRIKKKFYHLEATRMIEEFPIQHDHFSSVDHLITRNIILRTIDIYDHNENDRVTTK